MNIAHAKPGRLANFIASSRRHATLFSNASALTIGTLTTAVLGFFYWWFAARHMPPLAVGYAAAAISAINLLALMGELGLGTLLIGEVPKLADRAASVISAALLTTFLAAGCLAGAALLVASMVSLQLGSITTGFFNPILFVIGAGLTGFLVVLDQAAVALLRGYLFMFRNIGFAVAKLALLVAFGLTGMADEAVILGTWVAGQVVSLAVLAAIMLSRRQTVAYRWPNVSALRPLLKQVFQHHILNIVIQAPGLVLPIVVTAILSAQINAAFYAAWTLIGVVLLIPASLASVLYAIGRRAPEQQAEGLQMSLFISMGLGVAAGVGFFYLGNFVLDCFNPSYPAIAGPSLQILGFAIIGVMLKYHYVMIQRLRYRLVEASILFAIGGFLEVAAAMIGGLINGLVGLTVGWACAVAVEAIIVSPLIISALRKPAQEVARPLIEIVPRGSPDEHADNNTRRAMNRLIACVLISASLVIGLAWPAAADAKVAGGGFVRIDGTSFQLDGKPYRIAGVNNHYLTYGSRAEITRVLDDAVTLGANVVRTFIQPVIGSADGVTPTIWNRKSDADSSNLGARDVYMLSWDAKTSSPLFNDGENGLKRLDFLLDEASKRELKLIVSFLDFWAYLGGAQQISAWLGSSDKYTFFAKDPRARQIYKSWVTHVITRINTINNRPYKDDATIFAWELMNEPDIHPVDLLKDWLTDMATHVKSLDEKHLLSTGHGNVKARLLELQIPTIDFGTWHGYPTYEKISIDQFDSQIREFCAIGQSYNKPVVLEEFGLPRSDPKQADAYRLWLNTIDNTPGCAGWVVWRLTSRQDHGRYPDDHDQFDIVNQPGPTWSVLRDAANTVKEFNSR